MQLRRQFAWNVKAYFLENTRIFWKKKNKKNIISLWSAEFAKRIIKVNSGNTYCELVVTNHLKYILLLQTDVERNERRDTITATSQFFFLSNSLKVLEVFSAPLRVLTQV